MICSETEAVKEFAALVHFHARRYASWGVDQEDLVQEGLLGVVRAWRTWAPSRGKSLFWWCSLHIKSKMRHAIGEVGPGRRLRQPRNDASLDAPIETGSEMTLHDYVASPATQESEVTAREVMTAVDLAIEGLSTRERNIVRERLTGRTHVSIAGDLGCSAERVRQLEEGAHEKLRIRLIGYRDAA